MLYPTIYSSLTPFQRTAEPMQDWLELCWSNESLQSTYASIDSIRTFKLSLRCRPGEPGVFGPLEPEPLEKKTWTRSRSRLEKKSAPQPCSDGYSVSNFNSTDPGPRMCFTKVLIRVEHLVFRGFFTSFASINIIIFRDLIVPRI